MVNMNAISKVLLVVALLPFNASVGRAAQSAEPKEYPAGVLWTDPGDISSRNLHYGPGSPDRAPDPPFTFVAEDTGGTQPKVKVRDARGTEWQVKLGIESQAETVATRLVWAVGYFADEAYFLHDVPIAGLPELSRGADFVKPGGIVAHARFEPRHPEVERIGTWEWEDNPFVGTRELDGLKVLMILLNNWDARDANNVIVRVNQPGASPEIRYMVSDLGSALGKTGGWGTHTKNDVTDFAGSKFVEKVEDGIVKFHYSVRPTGLTTVTMIYPPYFGRVQDVEQSMDGIKVEHAYWIGTLLSGLSDDQLRDALAAARYPDDSIRTYVAVLRARINQLTSLPAADRLTKR